MRPRWQRSEKRQNQGDDQSGSEHVCIFVREKGAAMFEAAPLSGYLVLLAQASRGGVNRLSNGFAGD